RPWAAGVAHCRPIVDRAEVIPCRPGGACMHRYLGLVAGVVFGIALVATCGSPSVKQMLADMGLVGDGSTMDIGSADARASDDGQGLPQPMALSGACNNINVRSGQSTYFAEIAVAGLDPTTAPQVSAVICN